MTTTFQIAFFRFATFSFRFLLFLLCYSPVFLFAQESPQELAAIVSRTVRESVANWAEPSDRLVLKDKVDDILDSKLRTLYRIPLEAQIAAAYDDISSYNPFNESFEEGIVFLDGGIALRFDANRIVNLPYDYLNKTCTIKWNDVGVVIYDNESKAMVVVSVAQSTVSPVEMSKLFQDVVWRMTKGLEEDRLEAKKAAAAAAARRRERLRVEGACEKANNYYDQKKYKSAIYHYSRESDSPYFTPLAKSNYGYCLFSGLGVTKDIDKAVMLWQQAAEAKVPKGLNNYGTCFVNGSGVTKNLRKAESLFLEAGRLGFALAYQNLASLYYDHPGDLQDNTKARRYALLAVEKGNPPDNRMLGNMYWNGQGGPIDRQKGINYFSTCADENKNFDCAQIAGLIYSNEILGAKLDYVKARKYLKMASDQGKVKATAIYGRLLANGLGGAEDVTTGIKLLNKAMLAEDASAPYYLGELYYFGEKAPQDLQKATNLFLISAKKDYPNGQYAVGSMYEDGAGINQNMELAIYWYKKAAAQGHLKAKAELKRLGR